MNAAEVNQALLSWRTNFIRRQIEDGDFDLQVFKLVEEHEERTGHIMNLFQQKFDDALNDATISSMKIEEQRMAKIRTDLETIEAFHFLAFQSHFFKQIELALKNINNQLHLENPLKTDDKDIDPSQKVFSDVKLEIKKIIRPKLQDIEELSHKIQALNNESASLLGKKFRIKSREKVLQIENELISKSMSADFDFNLPKMKAEEELKKKIGEIEDEIKDQKTKLLEFGISEFNILPDDIIEMRLEREIDHLESLDLGSN
jgi:hypothetical protein